MNQYTVKHSLSWRTRLKISFIRKHPYLEEHIIQGISGLEGVTVANIRIKSASLIIKHTLPIEVRNVFAVLDRILETKIRGLSCQSVRHRPSMSARRDRGNYILSENDFGRPEGGSCMFNTATTDNVSKAFFGRLYVSDLALILSGVFIVACRVTSFLLPAIGATVFLKGLLSLQAITAVGLSVPIIREGISNFRQTGKPNLSLLSTSALYYSIFTGAAETALLVFWLFNLSGRLEERIKAKTHKTIREMLRTDTRDAWLLKDGVEIQVPVSELEPGDIISLRFGSCIPADGIVVEGEALVCESPMTGESMFVPKKQGSRLMAGTTVEIGHVIMSVVSVGEETRIASIIRMVENAELSKSPALRIAERLGQFLFPISVSLFFGTLLLTHNMMLAMSMLIIVCPCAIRLSSAAALTACMGNAAQKGILIKGGEHLETAGKINTLVFDKTGTLTSGIPKVSHVIVLDDDFDPTLILQMTAAVQMPWKHPMTLAVLEKVHEIGGKIPLAKNNEFIVGRGVKAIVAGQEWIAGSQIFMKECHIQFQESTLLCDIMLSRTEQIIFVACDGKPAGLIGIENRVKSNAASILSALKKMGVHYIAMLTGDREGTAKSTAEKLPIDEVKWLMSPEDKAEWIRTRKQNHPDEVIAMVGDGINDTPAFAFSDLSFAMGETGTDAAVEHADIVIQRSDLALVAESIRLGRQCLSTINQNFKFTIGANICLGVLTSAQIITPFAGAFVHNLVTLAAVGNSGQLALSNNNMSDFELESTIDTNGKSNEDDQKKITAIKDYLVPQLNGKSRYKTQ